MDEEQLEFDKTKKQLKKADIGDEIDEHDVEKDFDDFRDVENDVE
jgi:hypothetical protein